VTAEEKMVQEETILIGAIVIIVAGVILWIVWSLNQVSSLLPDGSFCQDANQCVSQICCLKNNVSTCSSECAELGVGENCQPAESTCQAGLRCCRGKRDDDTVCRSSAQCREPNPGTTCVSGQDCTDLECCQTDQTGVSVCSETRDCLKDAGQLCHFDRDCRSNVCCDNKCRALRKDCKLLKENGEPCVDYTDCASNMCCQGTCSFDICQNLKPLGETCDAHDQCQSNVCCDNVFSSSKVCSAPDECSHRLELNQLCRLDASCPDQVACCFTNDRQEWPTCAASTCLLGEGTTCTPLGTACEPPLACCGDIQGQLACRPLETCVNGENFLCSSHEACSGPLLCCDRDGKNKCSSQCEKRKCLSSNDTLQDCVPDGKPVCSLCSPTKTCTVVSAEQPFDMLWRDAGVVAVQTGACWLPEKQKTCHPFTGRDMFVPEEEWCGCQCTQPLLVAQTAFGGPCDQVLACRPNGTLIHPDTFERWSIESTWDPAVGVCQCKPGYTFQQNEDGTKVCV